jgi:hypothetical protein
MSFQGASGVSQDPLMVANSYDIVLTPISSPNIPSPSKLVGSGSSTFFVVPGSGVYDINGRVVIPSIPSRVLVDAVMGYVAFREGPQRSGHSVARTESSENGTQGFNYTLYTFEAGILGPFNVTNTNLAPPGTQFTDMLIPMPLSISSIDVNANGDLLIQDTSGVIYVLPKGEHMWTPLRYAPPSLPPRLYGPKFYSSGADDVSYVSGGLLQFNGDMQGAMYPIDIQGTQTYNVADYSIQPGYTLLVASNGTSYNLFMGVSGTLNMIPGYVDQNTKVLALPDGAYIYMAKSCT